LELHPGPLKDGRRESGAHGWHVHLAFGRFLSQAQLQEMWGHGAVRFSLRRKRKHQGPDLTTGAELSRSVASYVGKQLAGYVTKDQQAGCGRHAYEVGQGFQPKVLQLVGNSVDDLVVYAVVFFGGQEPQAAWSSDELLTEWRGPLVEWRAWDP
jgi:hypothetical protein